MSLTPVGRLESTKDYAEIAKRYYELLCALAPDYVGELPDEYVGWNDLTEANRQLLTAVFLNLIAEGTIR